MNITFLWYFYSVIFTNACRKKEKNLHIHTVVNDSLGHRGNQQLTEFLFLFLLLRKAEQSWHGHIWCCWPRTVFGLCFSYSPAISTIEKEQLKFYKLFHFFQLSSTTTTTTKSSQCSWYFSVGVAGIHAGGSCSDCAMWPLAGIWPSQRRKAFIWLIETRLTSAQPLSVFDPQRSGVTLTQSLAQLSQTHLYMM